VECNACARSLPRQQLAVSQHSQASNFFFYCWMFYISQDLTKLALPTHVTHFCWSLFAATCTHWLETGSYSTACLVFVGLFFGHVRYFLLPHFPLPAVALFTCDSHKICSCQNLLTKIPAAAFFLKKPYNN